MPVFQRGNLRLYYAERGDSDGLPIVLLHGLLLSSRTMERLAGSLPGYRALLLDLHGHGKSSRPRDPTRYTLAELAGDVVALLDHLGYREAVVGGMSLGANVALEVAVRHPDRVRALVMEMPVFARGEPVGRPAFGALASFYRAVAPVADLVRPVARRVPLPRQAYELVAARDLLVSDHRADAALLRGLLREAVPATDAETLARVTVPALVVGHGGDPLHAFDDAAELASRLPRGRLVSAHTFFDYRFRPDRLAAEVRRFLDELGESGQGGPPGASGPQDRPRSASKVSSGGQGDASGRSGGVDAGDRGPGPGRRRAPAAAPGRGAGVHRAHRG